MPTGNYDNKMTKAMPVGKRKVGSWQNSQKNIPKGMFLNCPESRRDDISVGMKFR